MYNIIEKNNKSLYTVVYSYGQLTLPVHKSTSYQDCVDYIGKQPIETKEYNEDESKKALQRCLNKLVKKEIK